MAWFAPLVGGIAKVAIPIAQIGMSIYQATQKPKTSRSVDTTAALLQAQEKKNTEAAAAEENKRKAYLASLAGGRGATLLTSGKGLAGADVLQQGLKMTLGG